MKEIISKIRKKLSENIDEKAKQSFPRFFTHPIQCYGVRAPMVRKIASSSFIELKKYDKSEIFALCEELYASKWCEEAAIAANWLKRISKYFVPDDLPWLAQVIDLYVDDWAKCDSLCTQTMGNFVVHHPSIIPAVIEWTNSRNPYVRRASAVSFILPARRGLFLNEAFVISEKLLLDSHDLVQKGYGWLLKEASREHSEEVFSFLIKRNKIMPRTAFRYALEKMDSRLRRQAMEKR